MAEAVEQAEVTAMIPVAWAARVSNKDAQDPTLSLPRQLNRIREALPPNLVIVAHFWDIESGRMELDKRGQGHAQDELDIQLPRDGGLPDLLAEAKEKDRRFVAVVCESVDRIARVTYFGTRVEYELEQSGVPLLALDEGINADALAQALTDATSSKPKKAGSILTRRMKQVIAEWYVLNMLELSWGGFVEHTKQGWNVGKPLYGYKAQKVPHPVPAKRAEGRTKHRLIPDEVRGPVVTNIFRLRVGERLGYDEIAGHLNLDLERFPPPVPPDPSRARGLWTWSSVRDVLHNPKYTGYMVWNRRATKKGGKHNPPDQWVWSPQPVHEPLVTRALFEQAAEIAKERERTRASTAESTHPKQRYTYLLRSYIKHDTCDRRMLGKTERSRTYYSCERKAHRDCGKAWYDQHPPAARIRADAIHDAVHEFFATRVFGPDRQRLFAETLTTVSQDDGAELERAERADALRKQIAEERAKQDRLLDELESSPADDAMDEDIRKAFRQRLHGRFAETTKRIKAREAELQKLADALTATHKGGDAELLATLPELAGDFSRSPEDLQRDLYDALKLEIVYSHVRCEAMIEVTITDNSADSLHRVVEPLISENGTHGSVGCPQRDSNPCYRLERAAS
jgi:site-specific DNA recombinase